MNPFTTGGAAVSLVPGQTFGQRYQIISLLGVGGMGAVYHVWDSELGLSLALKVIKPDSDPLATQELERRFKRELVLARQVTHTNVIRIHDLGEIDGIKYITMPFVHGTDLARLLAKEGKLPVARALSLARQIVSGLRAAHEVGIVHRDLKPANILIDDSEKAVITDFGIARSTDAGTFATAAGAIIGTLAYMAPEQATGKPVDQRADIYAFGLILSEMLVGKRGSSGGDTALALLIERASHAPPRLRTIDPSIPEALDRSSRAASSPTRRRAIRRRRSSRRRSIGSTPKGTRASRAPPSSLRSRARAVGRSWLLRLRSVWRSAWAAGCTCDLRPAAPPPARAGARAGVGADRRLRQSGERSRLHGIARTGAEHRHRGRVVHHELFASDRAADRRSSSSPARRSTRRRPGWWREREGIKIVLTGSIATDGSGYS